jgi:putative tryptophan/tyrosine transport system substrate-binding protein
MRRRDFITGLCGAAAAYAAAVPAIYPLRAHAESNGRLPRVGYLWHAGSPEEENPYYAAIVEGFAGLGYVDGRTIELIHRFPNEKPEGFESMAQELVALKLDVVMGGSVASFYLQAATRTVPIIFNFIPDPVGTGLVQSLSHPGGNITGLSNFGHDIAGKRLQLLKEVVPDLSRVAMLINSNQRTTKMYLDVTRMAADELGLSLQAFDARSRDELRDAFDAMVRAGMQALIPAQGGTSFQWRALIPQLAMEARLALCAYSRETFMPGALLSYGPDQIEMCHRAAVLADKIIKGANPGDIPVEQPTKFEFFLNLKVARTLGLRVSTASLLRADQVVE